MQQGYFSRAWRAVRESESWFGTLCLLSLVSLIPVFGTIVVSGYLLGWARDAAWGMDNPLPRRVFGNEDGRLYRRGFFALVINAVVAVCIGLFAFVCMSLLGIAAALFSVLLDDFSRAGVFAVSSWAGTTGILIACVILAFASQFFVWVGLMRMSIYDTLGSGFQFGHMVAMAKRDISGLLKIFFYQLLASLAAGVLLSVAWLVVAFLGIVVSMMLAGAADFSGISAYGLEGVAVLGFISAGVFAVLVGYASAVCVTLIQALVYRSLGYWTARFDVASWGSQDDPLPDAYPQGV